MKRYIPIFEKMNNISTDLENIKQEFINQATRIWGANAISQIKVNVEIDSTKGALMALGHEQIQQKAIRDFLLKYPKEVTLYIHPEAFDLSEKNFLRVIIHETLHLGYNYHDKYFRDMVQKYDAAYTEKSPDLAPTEGLYKVQRKDDARYKTVDEFDDLEMAKNFAQDEMLKNRKKYRIIF